MKRLKLILLSTLCFAFTGLIFAQAPSEKELEAERERQARAERLYKGLNVKRDVVYKKSNGKDVTMDIILPEKKKFKKGAPILVNIHGGGWNGGDRYHVGGAYAKELNDMGIALATISYTFANGGDTNTNIISCITDVKDALRFLAKNAKKYDIDASRIITTGHSAGGHLSLLAALTSDDMFPGDVTLKGYNPKIVGAIGKAPVASFVNSDCDYPGTVSYGYGCFVRLFGDGTPNVSELRNVKDKHIYDYIKEVNPKDSRLALAENTSPIKYLKKDSCPVLIMHGNKDSLVSYKTSAKMEELAKKIGANVCYVQITNADHGLRAVETKESKANKDSKNKTYEEISVSPDSQGKITDLFIKQYLLKDIE